MKKIFLLIPILAFAMMAKADVINIEPGTKVSWTINDANPGDVIVLADGLYPAEDQFHLTKDITIKAAANAHPVVQTTYYCELKSGAKVFIEGITFDGANSSQQFVRTYDATAGKELHLNNCEFKNYKKDVISGDKAEYTLDSCVVTNCYFHNNDYSPIYFNKSSVEGKQTIYGLIVKNSTFANNNAALEYRSVIDVRSYASDGSHPDATDDIEVLVDHCTFYNNATINYDYSAVRTRIVNRTTVSNCIFAHPSLIEFYATNAWAGNVTNCLAYNLNKGYMSGPTHTNTNTGDPLFTDAANGDYSFAGDWTTMQLSPARGAATDGSDLGDPRWYSDEVLPESNFVSPYAFVGEKALLAGNIWYNSDDAYLYYNDKSECGTATWKINATRNGAMKVTLNMNAGTTTGHKFKVELFDANGNLIDETAEPSQKADAGDIDLEKTLVIPAIGDYIVKLSNLTGWSSAKINSITLAYMGGAMQNIPGTILPEEAMRSSLAFVNEAGELRFTDDDHTGYILDQWAKWNIHVSKEGNYKFATHVNSTNGHSYTVNIYNSDETVLKGTASMPEAGNYGHERTFSTDNIYLEEGDYIIKVQNNTNYSKGRVIDIVATYERGARQNVPGQILGEDAMICKEESSTHDVKMYHLENGDLQYNDNGHNLEEYALWNIHADAACELSVTLNIAHSGHMFTVELYDGETLLGTAIEADATKWDGGNIELEDHLNIPAAGNYTIKLINRQQYSGGALHGITFTEIVPPTVVAMDEMAEDNTAWISYKDGDAVNVQLTRTITAGMYNTICLPFDVDGTQTKAIFGNDVELYTLGSTTYEGGILTLNIDPASDIYHGTPYLIKTSADVVNPQFAGVQILSAVPANTSSTYVDFIGNFIKSEVPAGENNLFLGPNNLLYFSQTATDIKGMRAYFNVKVPGAANAIKRARIVAQGQTVTAIDLVGADNNTIKTIENGQLVIIRDGVRYNVMGTKIQ